MDMKKFRGMVDREIGSRCGLTSSDLADCVDMHDYFAEDMSEDEAREAARECAIAILEEEGFPFDEDDGDYD